MRTIIVSLIILALGGISAQTKEPIADRCSALMSAFHPDGIKALDVNDPRASALAERHQLIDLLPANPEDVTTSLLYKAPGLAMNAAQRFMHLARAAGSKEMFDARPGFGKVSVWNLLSGKSPYNQTRIIGHEKTLDEMVGSWMLQAGGSQKINVVLLTGAPGSGKSATLNIVREAIQYSTLNIPDHFLYRFRFTNLKGIKALEMYLPKRGNEIIDDSLPSPFFVNPLGLLPASVQKAALATVKDRVRGLSGYDPLPDTRLPRRVQAVRDAIIKSYAAERGHALSPLEEIEVLNKHIVLERYLADESNLPLINAQPKDVRMGPLFMTLHPIFGTVNGPNDPFAYNYGLVLNGNGFGVFLEEFLKNEPYLTRVFLTFFQDRFVSIDGAPPTPWDGVIFVVTNPDDIKAVRKKDPNSPLLDRIKALPMDLELFPDQIEKLLLLTEKRLVVRRLGDPDAKWVRPDLDEIIPRREQGIAGKFPERRYALAIEDDAGEKFSISPHALSFISLITAATRYNFDPSKVPSSYPNILPNELRNRTLRLKAMMGSAGLTSTEMEKMFQLSAETKEGTFGLSNRDLDKIWPRILNEARKSDYGRTITVQLIARVLADVMRDDKVLSENASLRNEITLLTEIVKKDFIVPEMMKDLTSALASAKGVDMARTYWDIVSEIMERGRNPDAKEYVSLVDGNRKLVQRARFDEIVKIYQDLTRRGISGADLSLMLRGFVEVRAADPNSKWWLSAPRNPDLENAITHWMLNNEARSKDALLDRFLQMAQNQAASGDDSEQLAYTQFIQTLEVNFGYNPMAAWAALELWKAHQDVQAQ